MNDMPLVYDVALKDAALYFDEFIPFFLVGNLTQEDVSYMEDILSGPEVSSEEDIMARFLQWSTSRVYPDLSVSDLLNMIPASRRDDYSTYLAILAQYILIYIGTWSINALENDDDKQILLDSYNQFGKYLNESIHQFEVNGHPLLAVENDLSSHFSAEADNDPVITLARLRLVDTSKVSWQQIFELRKDEVALQKLRRLRSFARSEYKGKSISEISDEIQVLIEDYEELARQQGLNLIETSYSVVSESPVFLALVGTLLSLRSISDITAALAAGAVSLEIGKIILRVGKSYDERRRALILHEASYLAHLRKALAKSGLQ